MLGLHRPVPVDQMTEGRLISGRQLLHEFCVVAVHRRLAVSCSRMIKGYRGKLAGELLDSSSSLLGEAKCQ